MNIPSPMFTVQNKFNQWLDSSIYLNNALFTFRPIRQNYDNIPQHTRVNNSELRRYQDNLVSERATLIWRLNFQNRFNQLVIMRDLIADRSFYFNSSDVLWIIRNVKKYFKK